jgi:chemotaxis protein CheX
MSALAAVDTVAVTAIAAEVFDAMIDREGGLLTPATDTSMGVSDPLHAWVDLGTVPASRLQLTTDVGTAASLTRAFLSMGEAEPVTQADVADAFAEIANVFGGNIKALLPEHVDLTLPEVSRQSPSGDRAVLLSETRLAWRGCPLVISLYTI